MPLHRSLEHVALRAVEVGHAAGVSEEAVDPPCGEERMRDHLGEGCGLQIRAGRVEVDGAEQRGGPGREAYSHARGEDLGDRVETQDTADGMAGAGGVRAFQCKVRWHPVGAVEEIEVRVVCVVISRRKDRVVCSMCLP